VSVRFPPPDSYGVCGRVGGSRGLPAGGAVGALDALTRSQTIGVSAGREAPRVVDQVVRVCVVLPSEAGMTRSAVDEVGGEAARLT
jgi:hypothetical protein